MGPQNVRGLEGQMPWKELNMDEKIERIHEVVRNMVQKFSTFERQLNETTQNVKNHSHDDKDGEAIVKQKIGTSREYQEIPMNQPYPPGTISTGLLPPIPQLDNSEDTYF